MSLWLKKNNPSKYLGNELKYLKMVLAAESWSATGGSWSNKLEADFAQMMGSKYAVAMNSGTATLHAALHALGVGPGDEVITPALTVIMDTTAILHANAIPVYADVVESTFNLDVSKIENLITPRTKAIICVSLYGLPCNMTELMEIANRHGIPVIEDNAQCILSTYDGKLAGSFGQISSWSFENTKHISCGEGGIVTTNDEGLAESMRKFGGHGFKNLSASEGRIRLNQDVFQDPNYKRHDSLGWNYRLPEFNAAVALAQLERIEKLVQMRIASANFFLETFHDSNIFIPQEISDRSTHSYYTLGARYIGDITYGVTWQEFRKAYLQESGDGIYGAWSVPYQEPLISTNVFRTHNPSIYRDVSYFDGSCPIAEKIQPQLMQFKTNYRDTKLASRKARALARTIEKVKHAQI
jgi:perosamine synthetase